MNAKEQKIKEAWSKIGIDNLEHIEGNDGLGWRSNSNVKYDTWDGRFEVNNFFHRPKELTGIETNNNWIPIYSENDLPTDETIRYYHYHLPSKERMKALGVELDTYTCTWIKNLYMAGLCTHYQPIVVKNHPPIY